MNDVVNFYLVLGDIDGIVVISYDYVLIGFVIFIIYYVKCIFKFFWLIEVNIY